MKAVLALALLTMLAGCASNPYDHAAQRAPAYQNCPPPVTVYPQAQQTPPARSQEATDGGEYDEYGRSTSSDFDRALAAAGPWLRIILGPTSGTYY